MKMRFVIVLLVVCVGLQVVLSADTCQQKKIKDVKEGGNWRGTNLGSWFVLESYMATHLWKDNNCDDNKYQGSYMWEQCVGSKAQELMEKHWSTWITEADFEDMAKHGINVVRIPVGWWNIYDPQGGAMKAKLNYTISAKNYAVGGLKYLDKAFEWAKKHGIGIMLDLHSGPGSQNGYDNSSPETVGQKQWGHNPAGPGQSADSIELYAERYGKEEALVGFDLLNEPDPGATDLATLQNYYKKAYANFRKHNQDAWVFIMPLQNGGLPYSEWADFMTKEQGFSKVAMDIHFYSCFGGPQDTKSIDTVLKYINTNMKDLIAQYEKINKKPILLGEWSACQHADDTKFGDFFKAQAQVYSAANMGWTFWSWTDRGTAGEHSGWCNYGAWSLKTAFKNGWATNLTTPC